jgi:hypothetical protein
MGFFGIFQAEAIAEHGSSKAWMNGPSGVY